MRLFYPGLRHSITDGPWAVRARVGMGPSTPRRIARSRRFVEMFALTASPFELLLLWSLLLQINRMVVSANAFFFGFPEPCPAPARAEGCRRLMYIGGYTIPSRYRKKKNKEKGGGESGWQHIGRGEKIQWVGHEATISV
jgi:hypothetical protein